ncbi:MAG TPA: ComF family protein [Polyangiaceae bacterium]
MQSLLLLLGRVAQATIHLASPPLCPSCEEPSRDHQSFCSQCAAALEPDRRPSFQICGAPTVAAAHYEPTIARAIKRFKYQDRPDLADPLAALLTAHLVAFRNRCDLVLAPVPLHPRRLAARGFNQASLIARSVSKSLGIRFAPLLLRRTRDTEQQASQDPVQRWTNVAGAFAVRSPRRAHKLSAILVDDVITTGATATECAKALEAADIRLIAVAAVARGG